jgi:hypothetical protein
MSDTSSRSEQNKVKRINFSYIIHEINHLLHFESGFFYTFKELLIRPGKVVRNFILYDRTKATKPLVFLIFSATIFTLLFHFLHIDFIFFSVGENIGNIDQYLKKESINDWLNNHIGYACLLIGITIAFWISIFFKKQHYNIYEIVVLLCYSMGQALLIITLFTAISHLTKIKLLPNIGIIVSYLYIFWAIGQFFGEKRIINYVKSALCCIFGVITFRLIYILLSSIFYQLG